jgi:hypothetical protein
MLMLGSRAVSTWFGFRSPYPDIFSSFSRHEYRAFTVKYTLAGSLETLSYLIYIDIIILEWALN